MMAGDRFQWVGYWFNPIHQEVPSGFSVIFLRLRRNIQVIAKLERNKEEGNMQQCQADITIDCSKPAGSFRRIHGTNVGPIYRQGAYNACEFFKQVRFPTVRLHDCPHACFDVVDVPCIFPLFHLDPADPANYVFRATDSYIQSILDCDCGIVYRLGVSLRRRPEFSGLTDPPADFKKWADICIQIIRHYNEGWAGGFHHNIRYWEIWNEADNGATQWNGTYESFIAFFITAAKRIKAVCPDISIGGPAFNGSIRNSRDKLHSFLPKLRDTGCPLDFLSWHTYPDSAGEIAVASREVRAILDHYGFTKTENHLNEWNMAPFPGGFKGMRATPQTERDFFAYKNSSAGASLAATCLIAMQDLPLDMTNYYSSMNFNYGMFSFQGLPHKPYYAFRALTTLMDASPERLAVSGSDPDHGLAVLAGLAADGSRISMFLANHGSDRDRWTIDLDRAPRSMEEAQILCIDPEHDLQTVCDAISVQGNRISLHMPRHTVGLANLLVAK
ncbi:MAG: hypothetical protein HYV35_04595 [Lentisphaerae bacterium]|nr:hypothetical protein [Lentisphaerota bacterium]